MALLLEHKEITWLVLREFYKDTVVPELIKQFGYKSVMEVPRIEKYLNMGVGEAVADKKVMEHAVSDLEKLLVKTSSYCCS